MAKKKNRIDVLLVLCCLRLAAVIGEVRRVIAADSRWNSLPGSRFGTIGATDESLTNTAFRSCHAP